MARNKSDQLEQLTTPQRLASLIKSARDLMRKDKGLNGDMDRLPMLTWLMFLKFLDDLETERRVATELEGRRYSSLIDAPYRWQDWAQSDLTGEALIAFINNDEAPGPDGKRGPGLFQYLSNLQSGEGGDTRDVIRTVFDGIRNRMESGYLLKDVIGKVDQIHFNSTDEMQTLGSLYESMLREMRDAAGDGGEFYTPRPVVRLMVAILNPQLGETILDPACGTGGFLAEAFTHLQSQCKKAADYKILQDSSIYGQEAKSLPYLLCQMNLVLHGLENPRIADGNSLAVKLTEIGDSERVDVIITNPPFGGEEEAAIKKGFPADKQTSETALLFLQLIMRRLRRQPKAGRAAVVVPNGTLYAEGTAARIRRQLIEEFNLHTVVRLPKGVFEPYADIPTNILFFDRSRPTSDIWFYQHPIPPNRQHLKTPSYSMSDPLRYEEFHPLQEWWNERIENSRAWCITKDEIDSQTFSLDLQHPQIRRATVPELKLTARQIKSEINSSVSMAALIQELQESVEMLATESIDDLQVDTLGRTCFLTKGTASAQNESPGSYPLVVTAAERKSSRNFQFDEPTVLVPMVSSTGHGHASIHRLHYQEGKHAVASILVALRVKPDIELLPKYLYYYLTANKEAKLVRLMKGTANTALSLKKLEPVQIAYPSIAHQQKIVDVLDALNDKIRSMRLMISLASDLADTLGKESLSLLLQETDFIRLNKLDVSV